MVRPLGWLSLLLLTLACSENVAAPGLCPDFCPTTRVEVVDTVVTDAIQQDTSYRGYVPPQDATMMQLSTIGDLSSHGVIRFTPFPEEVQWGSISVQTGPVVATDSFRLDLTLVSRSDELGEFELAIHRLPASVSTETSYTEVEPYFHDSTEIATILVPDTVAAGELYAVFPADGLPTLETDSLVAAIGVTMRSGQPGFVNLPTLNAGSGYVRLRRYVQVDSAGVEAVARSDSTLADLDTFVFPGFPAPDPSTLTVGGVPSARTVLRAELPSRILDSSDVVRATLVLVPAEPVLGAPGDTIRVAAYALSADIGPKSPVVPVDTASITYLSALVQVGTTDTVRIDVTHIVAPWASDPDLPRSLMLRAYREGAALGEARFNSIESAMAAPAIHITFVPEAMAGSR